MKKCLFLLIACLLACCAVPVSAGSVPEDLLHSDEAQIFFAEVVECRLKDGQRQVVLVPVVPVKGNVPVGEKVTYGDVVPVDDFRPQRNMAYLFAYFDEHNPTYVFRVSGYDTDRLSLLVSEDIRQNMFGRFEKYLNDGSYTKAEAARRQRLGLPSAASIVGKLPPLDKGGGGPWLIPTAVGAVLLTAAGAVMYGFGQVRWQKKEDK